jgi:hypothetical protein
VYNPPQQSGYKKLLDRVLHFKPTGDTQAPFKDDIETGRGLRLTSKGGRAIAQMSSRRFLIAVALVPFQVRSTWANISEYFGFPCQDSFQRLLHNHLVEKATAADVPSAISFTPPYEH